jgi:hypothetical protein
MWRPGTLPPGELPVGGRRLCISTKTALGVGLSGVLRQRKADEVAGDGSLATTLRYIQGDTAASGTSSS